MPVLKLFAPATGCSSYSPTLTLRRVFTLKRPVSGGARGVTARGLGETLAPLVYAHRPTKKKKKKVWRSPLGGKTKRRVAGAQHGFREEEKRRLVHYPGGNDAAVVMRSETNHPRCTSR